MIRRRSPRTPPPPTPATGTPVPGAPTEPEWSARIDTARAMLRDLHGASFDDHLTAIDRALRTADLDRAELARAIRRLDPDRAAAELKAALRSRRDATGPDDPLVLTLRRRHESIHALQNRLDDLDRHIEATLVDLDVLVARSVEQSLVRSSAPIRLDDELERLRLDAEALAAAHAELADL